MSSVKVSAEQRLDTLSSDKVELLRLLLEEEAREAQRIKPHNRDSAGAVVRASWAQQRLWFIDQLEGASAAYHIIVGFRLKGQLDLKALKDALDTIVERHEVLRTTFSATEGELNQTIAAAGKIQFRVFDLSNHADEGEIRRHAIEEECEAFDLGSGPLLRCRLLQLHADEQILLITMHHIISDGWSMGVLSRELTELYNAYRKGEKNPLPSMTIQYADYAQWQHEWLKDRALEDQLTYWRTHLEGAESQLRIPTDRPRPATLSYRGALVSFNLQKQVSSKLRRFAQHHETTLFMVLHAAWVILLSRLTGQDDITVGTPISNRQRPELGQLIGFFVNTLPLRVSVGADLPVKELLGRVKDATLSAYAHQDVPFEKIVEAVQPQRSLSRNPLFQVMFSLQNSPKTDLTLEGLTVSVEESVAETSLFDLFLSMDDRGPEIVGSLNYATDIFNRRTIERWISCFEMLLTGMVDNPQARINELPITSASERHEVTRLFNQTECAYPNHKLIHELFEERVQRTPHAPAVLCGAREITYLDLNRRANQWACYLREQGLGPGHSAAVCIERSAELVACLIGILKAGASYVPLDPLHPTERLTYVIEDATPRLLLIDGRDRKRFVCKGPKLVILDECVNDVSSKNTENLDASTIGSTSRDLAYVIYTSGSTGAPKGVMVEHSGVVNFLISMQQQLHVVPADRFLALTTVSFDIAALEIFLPLVSGARIAMAVGVSADALPLIELIEKSGVTVLQATPATWKMLLDAGWQGGAGLRAVCGGEALTTDLSESLLSRVGGLWNMYGPTETTIWSTCQRIDQTNETDRRRTHVQPIGRPIPNTQVYILDSLQRPVPVGFVGEVYIGGAGVARGYLKKPELTAERFLMNPFDSQSERRIYRSGDTGRWRGDGTIEYVGRNDYQVKIRGYRIELGEIEAQLLRHPQIKEAVVLAREDEPGERRLVGYVVGDRNVASQVATEGVPDGLRKEIVSDWETLWKETYGSGKRSGRPNFAGWNSSYTDRPIAEEQMQEWLDAVVARIRALRPGRILEIGCGVGLLLQHLAPQATAYVGMDISAVALDQIRGWMEQRRDLTHVELLHRSATELQDLGSFDTVILNSVIQYFPDIEYLVSVLQEVVRHLSPGGKIFVGDVRHLGLLPLLHSDVQITKADSKVTVGELRERIARVVAQEKELLIDPEFFESLPGRLAGICSVDLQLKRGVASNELTRYRYDAVLYAGDRVEAQPVVETLRWQDSIQSLEQLGSYLLRRSSTAVRLTSIPNPRLARQALAKRLIETAEDHMEVGTLRGEVRELPLEGPGPEDFWTWGQDHGYDVQVNWDSHNPGEYFEVRLLSKSRSDSLRQLFSRNVEANKSWASYANDPLENSFRQQLIPLLRDYLKERLPEYMIPSAWVTLKQLPLTANGKINRRALPAPEVGAITTERYEAPEGELEVALARIWRELLRVERIGRKDNFFEVGGHSLLAARVVARVNHELDLNVPVRTVFEQPTIAAFADRILEDIAAELPA